MQILICVILLCVFLGVLYSINNSKKRKSLEINHIKDDKLNIKKSQIHILDKFFIITMIIIIIIAFILDVVINVHKANFPVYLLISVYIEYIIWFVFFIYSCFGFKKEIKSYFFKWYMFLIIPFIHIAIIIVVLMVGNLVLQIFK